MLKVGFTGSRAGLFPAQEAAVRRLLVELNADELHHGDCVGADEAVHRIAAELGLNIVIHPPVDDKNRAYCVGSLEEPLPYLERNRLIVARSQVIVACPWQTAEPRHIRGSGTWYTVRFARRKTMKSIYIVWSNGEVIHERAVDRGVVSR